MVVDKFDFLAVNGGGSRVQGVQESREIFIFRERSLLFSKSCATSSGNLSPPHDPLQIKVACCRP